MEFLATCPRGFEQLLADELGELGTRQVRPLTGQVSFSGSLEEGLIACMWSRLASRVVVVLSRFDAADADALYEGTSAIPWEDHLRGSTSFAIDAHGTNDRLRNTRFVAERAKDAIVDRMRSRTGARPRVDAQNPDVPLTLRLSRDRAMLGVSISGWSPLFRRGYERAGSRGPQGIRPDYACALLALAGVSRGDTVDVLFPGDGTLAVEAASVVAGRAPNLLRSGWGHLRWLGGDAGAWSRVLGAAGERGQGAVDPLLVADTRGGWEGATRALMRSAGLDVEIQRVTPAKLASRDGRAALVCDLSWPGDDIACQADALATFGEAAGDHSPITVLARDGSPDAALGQATASSLDVLLGRDEATMRTYDGAGATGRPQVTLKGGARVPVLVAASDQFAARLAKVAGERAAWAHDEDVSCYRVYDADLPDYNVSIDLYEALARGRHAGETWLYLSEYAAPRGVDEGLARRRLMDVLAIAPHVMGIDPAHVTCRTRTRARGGSQYASDADERRRVVRTIDEGGLDFEVDLGGHLDTGIFLDHRETRSMVREMAKRIPEGGRFLNLFAYTGTATCYAADGGAEHTTTVDLSRPYLDWAGRNLRRNGFEGDHELVQADVISWVGEQRHARGAARYDLVFCDPPTFSNSSRMRKSSFDVQRDHVELLIGVSRLLTQDGVCVFSCNLRSFKPDVEALRRANVSIEDITAQTIPHDFERNPKVHHCYLVRRMRRTARG